MKSISDIKEEMMKSMEKFNADEMTTIYDLKDGYRLSIKLQNPDAVKNDEQNDEEPFYLD